MFLISLHYRAKEQNSVPGRLFLQKQLEKKKKKAKTNLDSIALNIVYFFFFSCGKTISQVYSLLSF